ncbi:hypothetical protein [Natrinema ejinorense]|uniref:DUF4145 domain-containing protein n=1 Tax=Natrinema ejinorense TaxID=373386 RepID=A0A2A5QU98_9EURY|nr:hypothetical protein [Natrinema ejinorense]PCR90374.1 hypothetical protein CP557_07375 [Natrinema ejinorense]
MSDPPSDTDNNEEADSEDTTTRTATVEPTDATGEGTAGSDVNVVIGFSPDDIQGRLDDDKIAEALVLTATRLENILSHAIADRYNITTGQFEQLYGNAGLGRYQYMASILDLFDQHLGTIQDVVEYRNKLVHDYGYLDDLQDDDDERKAVKDAIEDAITFIGQTEI